MSILKILKFPDPKLRLPAKLVKNFNSKLQSIYKNMIHTMYNSEGIGLAATQVNIPWRILVLDISINKANPICLVNPKIIESIGTIIWEEGCLSFPGIYVKIKRSATIKVEFQDLSGDIQILKAESLLSVCIQHEIDHLNGITFFKHLSPIKQIMLRKKFFKQNHHVLRT